jgi:hypothetical protein
MKKFFNSIKANPVLFVVAIVIGGVLTWVSSGFNSLVGKIGGPLGAIINGVTGVAGKAIDLEIAKKQNVAASVPAPAGTSPDAKAAAAASGGLNTNTLVLAGASLAAVLGLVLVLKR